MKTQYFISESKKFSYAQNKNLRLRKRLRDNSIKEVKIKTRVNDIIDHLNKRESFIQTDYITFLTLETNVQ